MNKKQSNAKNIMLYIVLLCLIALIAFYFFVYQKMEEKTKRIQNENRTLQTRVTELEKYYNAREEYETGIKDMTAEIERIFEPYPCDVREENATDLGVNILLGTDSRFRSISIGEREALKTIEEETVKAAGLEEYTHAITFARRTVEYADSLDYKNLKDLIKIIDSKASKGTINSINYVYNETENNLEGSTGYSFFFVRGIDGKVYEPVSGYAYTSGLEDLFRIEETKQKQEKEAEKKADDTE